MNSAHRLTEVNILPDLIENPFRGKGDMERTRRCYGQMDGQTDKYDINISPHPLCGWEGVKIIKIMMHPKLQEPTFN